MSWDIEYTDEFEAWFAALTRRERGSIVVAVGALETAGPMLGRPFVDSIKGSRHKNMKELRPRGVTIRILFAFDPRRMAILLVGGDKRNRWKDWYATNIPIADRLYDEHLANVKKEQ